MIFDDVFYGLIISLVFFISFIPALVGSKLRIGKSDKYIQGITFGMVSMMLLYSILDHLQRYNLINNYLSSFIITFLIFLASHNIFYKPHIDRSVNTNTIEKGLVIEETYHIEKTDSYTFILYLLFFLMISFFKGLSILTFEPTYTLTAILSFTIYKIIESLLFGLKINTIASRPFIYLFLITLYNIYTLAGILCTDVNLILAIKVLKSKTIPNIVDGSFLGCLSFMFIESFYYLFVKSNFVNENGKYAFSKVLNVLFSICVGILIGSCVFITYGIDLELRDHSYVLKNNTNLPFTPVLNINSTTSFENLYDTMSKVMSKIIKLNFT